MIDWNFLYQSDDLDKTTNDVVNLITKISNKHAPIKKVSRTKQKQLNKPWISNGLNNFQYHLLLFITNPLH